MFLQLAAVRFRGNEDTKEKPEQDWDWDWTVGTGRVGILTAMVKAKVSDPKWLESRSRFLLALP